MLERLGHILPALVLLIISIVIFKAGERIYGFKQPFMFMLYELIAIGFALVAIFFLLQLESVN